MCGPKEPIAGVFLLLVLAAGGWVAQEPFPHFGIDVSAETLLNAAGSARTVSSRYRVQFDENRFTSAMLEPVPMYALVDEPARP
ncbi:hypothetical protein BTW15_05965 [Pseudomonas syringae pv. tomato]|uniref:Lipoprotein n=10 Tax=Pseudomonas syringae group TaxID=136849 RepID=A0AAW4DWH9_PSESX|nr:MULTISPECIES: hypothetical protein [Pseudomonas]AVI85116.1 hypothetical protein XJ28_16125 [Pseudomonas syringae pv. tomato]EEB58823.1 lipoprotein [Pseudomonas syringae pv. tomato T1]KGK95846.1 hypothetical protein NB04_08570 [Pseudomonas syringae pv. tomato]KKI27958.1 hypothetical protein WX98_01140 [Pseudomonas syringae pv. persicae]KPB76268.1 Lipoprotein [Pseudomonas syringae pv. maculicola]